MNFFVISFFFASTLALQSRESCTDIMVGKLCLKFQKKQFSSCKRSSDVVVSQNVACITGTEYCAKIIDICANVFDSPTVTVTPTLNKDLSLKEELKDLPIKEPDLTTTTVKPTKKELPLPVKVVPTTTTVKPTFKIDLPLPVKKQVVLLQVKESLVPTTTTVKPTTKRDLPLPVKEPVVLLQVKESLVPTTTTVKPTTKRDLPLPVKEPVVLLQVKESVVPTTTTTVTQIAKKELSPPIKKLLDLTAKVETTTTETPTTTTTPFGRFLLDRFHLKFSSLLESVRNTQVKIV